MDTDSNVRVGSQKATQHVGGCLRPNLSPKVVGCFEIVLFENDAGSERGWSINRRRSLSPLIFHPKNGARSVSGFPRGRMVFGEESLGVLISLSGTSMSYTMSQIRKEFFFLSTLPRSHVLVDFQCGQIGWPRHFLLTLGLPSQWTHIPHQRILCHEIISVKVWVQVWKSFSSLVCVKRAVETNFFPVFELDGRFDWGETDLGWKLSQPKKFSTHSCVIY